MIKINETIRKDGLRIISCHLPNKRSVSVQLSSRVGSAYDPSDKIGLFHYFEHMAFKGTTKRDVNALNDFKTQNFFYSNAFTERLFTTYLASTIDHKLAKACDLLTDIYLNSIFPADDINKEKQPVYLEIARHQDNDRSIANDALMEALYRENPVLRWGGGTVEGVKNVTRKDMLEQRAKWHVPSNTIALAVGNVKHTDFVKEISKRIPVNNQKTELLSWSDEVRETIVNKETIINRPQRQKSILILGCKLPYNPDMFTQEVFFLLGRTLGGTPSSPLWNEVREKRGLAYVVGSSSYSALGLAGYFYASAETEHSKIEQVEKLMRQVLSEPLTQKKSFEQLKERLFDSFEIAAAEHTFDYGTAIWNKILTGKPVKDIESHDRKRLKTIEKISLKDLEEARKEFLRPERLAKVAVIGK